MPRVSIIVPTYNGEKFIGRALQSALNQSFQDFEILVVDDVSTDDTKEKVMVLAKKDQRIRLIALEKNSGGGAVPRTTGCKVARGEFIAFLDQDDMYMPDYLKRKVEYFDLHKDINFLSSLAWTFDDDSKNKKIINCEIGGPVNTMTRRETLERVGFFKESQTNADDVGMWYRYIKIYGLTRNAMMSGEPLTLYSRSAKQESHTENRNPLIFIKRIDSILVDIDKNDDDPGVGHVLGYLYSRKANFYCLAGNFKVGRYFFKESLKREFNFFSTVLIMASFCPLFYKNFVSLIRFFRVNTIIKIRILIMRMKYNGSYYLATRVLGIA